MAGKPQGRVSLITGGDSGIGRSVACLFGLEGADVAIVYKGDIEEKDKNETLEAIKTLTHGLPSNLGFDYHCKREVDTVVDKLGRIDILVNNTVEQFYKENIEEITPEQLEGVVYREGQMVSECSHAEARSAFPSCHVMVFMASEDASYMTRQFGLHRIALVYVCKNSDVYRSAALVLPYVCKNRDVYRLAAPMTVVEKGRFPD
eukprot:Gb_09591 [translate_table: standard]